jgi:proline racemase
MCISQRHARDCSRAAIIPNLGTRLWFQALATLTMQEKAPVPVEYESKLDTWSV